MEGQVGEESTREEGDLTQQITIVESVGKNDVKDEMAGVSRERSRDGEEKE
jgi:hypothetical protein